MIPVGRKNRWENKKNRDLKRRDAPKAPLSKGLDALSKHAGGMFESVKILLRSILTEKPLLTQWACSLLQRIICLRNADKFHV